MATIVEPTGVDAIIDTRIPVSEQTTDTAAEQMTTFLKLLKTLIAERAGKITRAEIRSEPTRFMASTIIIAVMTAIIRLYADAFMPVAEVKVSSKVTAKILL